MVKEVIKSEPGRRWLHAHLTAAFTLFKRGKRFFRRPRIWLLTGKYVADDAKYKVVRNQTWKAQGKGGGPGDPSGVTSVQGGLEGGKGGDVEAEWTMTGKRVWACKWLLLKCSIRSVDMTEAVAEADEFDVHITDRYAQGSVRSDDEVLFARLEVASSQTVDKVGDDKVDEDKVEDDKVDDIKVDEDKAGKQNLVDDMSEEDWIAFDKVVKQAETEYA